MKSKRLFVFLIALFLIAVLIIINSTLFTLQNVSVIWLTNTTSNLKNVSNDDIIMQVDKGDSIFLLDKEEISKKLEKRYSYLRVVGIETKFPNKIVVYSAEREELYAIKLSDDNYAVIDDLGKVLALTNKTIVEGEDIDAKPIEVNFNISNQQLNSNDFVFGEDIKNNFVKNVLIEISKTLKIANYTTFTKKGVFDKIEIIPMGEGGEIAIHFETRNGMHINILDAEKDLTDKFMLGVAVYNKYHQDNYSTGNISILYSLEQEDIVAYYNDKKVDVN